MWTSLSYGFLYVLTGMVWNVDGITTLTNTPLGQAADWVDNGTALIERALATKNSTNTLAVVTQTVVRITWEDNTGASYTRTAVTNWGATNGCVTNFYATNYLYGKQEYSQIVRRNENNGFEMATTNAQWFNLANYTVSPLLWGGGFYQSSTLTSTVPTVLGTYQVAGQSGRYIYFWETNNWPYYVTNVVTNSEGVISTSVVASVVVTVNVGVTNIVTNGPPIWTTSIVEKVFLEYNPTNQRPNAITPLMSRSHILTMDAKLLELIPKYYNDTMAVAGSFDAYCATTGVYWVSNYAVGAIWFEMDAVTATTNQKYYTTVKPPNPVVSSVTTGTVAGSATNYDYTYMTTNNIAGTEADHDWVDYPVGADYELYAEWSSGPITYAEIEASAPKAGWFYTGGGYGGQMGYGFWIGPDGPSGGEWTTNGGGESRVITNIITSGGSEGTVGDHNADLSSSSERPSSTYQTNITSSTGVAGAGVAGEIDYYWEELEGTETNYTRRVYIDTTEVTSNHYDSTTVSNFTEASTVEHYNRTTSRTNHNRVFVWTAVSNLLAQYMSPWAVDHTNNWTSGNDDYKDSYLFNYGWSPSYSNSTWRLYSDAKYPTNFNYFWDWSVTHYWHQNYQYYKANTNASAPPWHYPRSYLYYWKYPTEVITQYWEDWYWWIWVPMGFSWVQHWGYHGDVTTNYYKYQDQLNYIKYTYITNYVITENRYTIKYQMFPSNPPLYTVPSFFSAHSNVLGNTNWLLSPTYLSETQSITSFDVLSVTNDGVISTWTNYNVTNTLITKTAVYSNDWAMSLWGDSFIQRHKAVDLLLWTAGAAWLESETRWDTTTNITTYPGWTTLYVTTNLTAGAYESSIYKSGWIGTYKYYTFRRSRIRAHRKPGGILDGQIDTYLKFGTVISGRYDIDNLGYPFGRYVRVTELTIPAGSMYSDWIGRIDTLPSYPDLEGYSWDHPYGFTIQNTSVSPIFIFQPTFAP